MWKCPQCSEQHEDQFASCWNCGADNPVQTDHDGGCQCAKCGAGLTVEQTAWGFPFPDAVHSIPEDERDDRVIDDQELFSIDGTEHFILGRLSIPVRGMADPIVYTCWVSISRRDFIYAVDIWENPDRSKTSPVVGRLANKLPGYTDALGLEVLLITQEPGVRPIIQIQPSAHRLSSDFRNGMTPEFAAELRRFLSEQL